MILIKYKTLILRWEPNHGNLANFINEEEEEDEWFWDYKHGWLKEGEPDPNYKSSEEEISE